MVPGRASSRVAGENSRNSIEAEQDLNLPWGCRQPVLVLSLREAKIIMAPTPQVL